MRSLRPLLITAVAGAAFCCGPAASQAYEGPWCANMSAGRGLIIHDCHFRSFEECAPNVLAGNRGFCTQNPRWEGYYERPVKHRKRHARRQ